MNRLNKMTSIALALVITASVAVAAPFTFGVISDTQDTAGTGTNSVATNIIAAVNQQFIAKGVSFVVQPGDLTDTGNAVSLQARLNANAPLTAAGIAFYGLRGNHEGDATSQAFFQANYIPASSGGVAVSVAPFDNTSYSVTYNGTKIVMLDYNTSGSTSLMDSATAWTGAQLGVADHTQAFVFHHKNLLGQNHKDNQFGSGNDSNPTQQNAFISTLQNNGVRYDISGHDHMDHRSMVTSPDGNSKVQELICASDSTKYYAASSGFSTRETVYSDQQDKIGYYTFTVDGPRVTGRYYATDHMPNGDISASPTWTLMETFGYSTNGKQFTVARGASYSAVSNSIASGSGFLGTAMSLGGTNTLTATAEGARAEADDVNTGWTPAVAGMRSDILTLWGLANALGATTTDAYALTMSYTPGAVSPVIAHQNDDGSWAPLASVDNLDGTISASGLNYAGNFAVVPQGFVPEPASVSLLVLGGLAVMARRRNRR
ncbi:MAG: metallophosphoesterase [Planctomycetota bacterium]|nr:metallophosphoesterase [Planctomycetota bacterium]